MPKSMNIRWSCVENSLCSFCSCVLCLPSSIKSICQRFCSEIILYRGSFNRSIWVVMTVRFGRLLELLLQRRHISKNINLVIIFIRSVGIYLLGFYSLFFSTISFSILTLFTLKDLTAYIVHF